MEPAPPPGMAVPRVSPGCFLSAALGTASACWGGTLGVPKILWGRRGTEGEGGQQFWKEKLCRSTCGHPVVWEGREWHGAGAMTPGRLWGCRKCFQMGLAGGGT